MRGEVREDLKGAEQLAAEGLSVEKQQEQLLMNKLAANGRLPPKPQTSFLQKKLQQQRVSCSLLVCSILNKNSARPNVGSIAASGILGNDATARSASTKNRRFRKFSRKIM
ncbi:unnamed protein product [Toxocara canis]|uniref:Uncharacterized protein n=1 Tax=Toxocara canis TaxID=6265 RepID=A0A183U6B4_TOXCA|nr:unnamed protein product [Toxocara canis]